MMDEKKLKQILEDHLHWLREDCDGWENMRADLSYADLSYADLSYADLRYADLRNVDLSYAKLINANLRNANLCYADLSNADLRYADLRNADLSYAKLINANLRNANLCYADLRNVDLSYADLCYAYNLDETTGLYLPTICPSDGAFTAWKKCRDGIIAKLLIPEQAKRSSASGRKCRASEAVVLALYDNNGAEVTEATSTHDPKFVYKTGETIRPKEPFDENRWNECASGIHFFVTREEAERYNG